MGFRPATSALAPKGPSCPALPTCARAGRPNAYLTQGGARWLLGGRLRLAVILRKARRASNTVIRSCIPADVLRTHVPPQDGARRSASSESISPASDHVGQRDPPADAGGLGRVLQPAAHLGTIPVREIAEGPTGVSSHVKAVPADVCENTGIVTDSARVNRSARRARRMAKPCRRLFAEQPMLDLQVPTL